MLIQISPSSHCSRLVGPTDRAAHRQAGGNLHEDHNQNNYNDYDNGQEGGNLQKKSVSIMIKKIHN